MPYLVVRSSHVIDERAHGSLFGVLLHVPGLQACVLRVINFHLAYSFQFQFQFISDFSQFTLN